MGIWDRLGNVIKSYVNAEDERIFGRGTARAPGDHSRHAQGDPDYDAAFEELNDFLGGRDTSKESENAGQKSREWSRPVPEGLKEDFAELGLAPTATMEECKEAYKKLLKIHHPDRHAGHPANMKKATEKAARVNSAYDRLEKWFKINQK